MANLKDLLVNGAARVIGKLYASEFVGNLNGTADTATKLGTSTVGDTTTPIYLNAGTPIALNYTISKSVPSNAVFTDTKVTQSSVTDSDYTNYRPLIFGSSNSSAAGFTPATVTDGVYACKGLYVRPSAGLIHATTFEGNATSSSSLKVAGNPLTTQEAIDGFLGSGVQYIVFKPSSQIVPGFGGNDGMILSIPWPDNVNYGAQIAFDDSTTGLVKVRGKSSTWGDWKQLWKEGDSITAPSITATTGFTGDLTGNASTATKLETARSLKITDGTNTSTGVDFNGTADVTLKLPTTIKAAFSGNLTGNVTGNVSGSSGSCTGNAATASKVKTVSSSENSKHYVSFVGSNWSSATAETVYTNTALTYNPSSGTLTATAVYGAVFNDLADSISVDDDCILEHGYCYCFDGEKYTKSSRYLDDGIIGIHSDTYGFKMGDEEEKKKMDVAVSGFVLAYVDREYKPGTPLTCTENGYLTEIKKEDKIEYPEKIIATYWKDEPSEEWGSEERKVKVNGRKWVKIY